MSYLHFQLSNHHNKMIQSWNLLTFNLVLISLFLTPLVARSEVAPNLLQNSGAEFGLAGWTVQQGNLESLTTGECSSIAPAKGEHYFSIGGVCNPSTLAEAFQEVDLSTHAEGIDDQRAKGLLSARLRTWSNIDQPTAFVIYYDTQGVETGRSSYLTTDNNLSDWVYVDNETSIPVHTRSARIFMRGQLNEPPANDSYIDDLSFSVSVEITPGNRCNTPNNRFCFEYYDANQFTMDGNGIINGSPQATRYEENIDRRVQGSLHPELSTSGTKVHVCLRDRSESGTSSIDSGDSDTADWATLKRNEVNVNTSTLAAVRSARCA